MGEKKRRLAAGEPLRPRFDARLLTAAFGALQSGDLPAAEQAFNRLQAAVPDDPDALHACGVLALQLGRTGRAEELLVRAIERNSGDPACRCHLAIAYRRLGKSDLAVAELERALQMDPGLAEAHSNLGNLLLERGEHDAAMRRFERALAIRAGYPEALNGLGDALLAAGDYERACANLERAIAVDPGFHEARYNLSRARTLWADSLESDEDATAPDAVANRELGLESILAALVSDADNPAYLLQFENCVGRFDLSDPVDPRLRAMLLGALAHPAVDPARLARPIASLVTTRPEALALRAAGLDARVPKERVPQLRALFDDVLLQRLLEAIVVPSVLVQRLCACARRTTLDEWRTAPASEPPIALPALAAVAHQAFNTEYVDDLTDDEQAGADELASAIVAARAGNRAVPLHWYALLACCRPLRNLPAAAEIARDLGTTPLAALSRAQIEEPREEERLRPAIGALTEVTNAVSTAVQSQYEANPYPRWLRVRREASQVSLATLLRRRFADADLDGVADPTTDILIAGCGTGRHPVTTAFRFPDARILAVDLSMTSLAYALRKTRELGIGNVEYRQADILDLGSLAARFDVVECTGVLHHLADPLAGWRTLLTLLRPGGLMRIGLYSELARRHVARARDLVAAQGLVATADGIRAFRRAVLEMTEDPLLARLARGEDFHSLSGLRDLVFHVQESRLTLPKIAGMIDALGLDFIGFDLPEGVAAAYRSQFPEDRRRASFDNWQRFEERRPDTFAQMYQFWVRTPVGLAG